MIEESQVNEGAETAPVENQQTNASEEKARRMGWVPQDEFRGAPEKWRPADEFVQRGEDQMPILRERLRHQDKQLADLQRVVKEFADYHTKVEQNAYQRALRELKTRQAQAVAAGDAQAFVEIDSAIDELRNDAALKKAPTVQEQAPEEHPVFRDWKSKNRWYDNDVEMTAYADNIGAYIKRVNPNMDGDEFFEAVTKKVKKEFPEKFENPRRSDAPAVEGAGNAPRKSGKSYADLPPEAKAACDRFVAKKLTTKERYVRQYFEDA